MKVNGKEIGTLVDGVLTKKGKQAVLFRVFDGFGMPRKLVDNPENIDSVEIHYEGKVYKAPIASYQTKGIPYHKPPFEPQIILPRQHFKVKQNGQLELL